MSLLKNEVLTLSYREVHSHDIEYKADAFWHAYLVSVFHQYEGYLVSCQWAPNDSSRNRVDAAVRQARGPPENRFIATLLLNETKRPGEHPKEAEDQIKSAAKQYLDSCEDAYVFGMSCWGTKARCWIIQKGSYIMQPMFGSNDGRNDRGKKDQYIDANSSDAIWISASILYIRGETEFWPNQYVEQLQQQYTRPQQGSSSYQDNPNY